MQHFDLGAVPIYLFNYLTLNASSSNRLLQTAKTKTTDRDNRYSKSQYSSLTQVMSIYKEPGDRQVLGYKGGAHKTSIPLLS